MAGGRLEHRLPVPVVFANRMRLLCGQACR